MDYMRTWVEVWPIAADGDGIWLLSGSKPWAAADAVRSGSTPWAEFEEVLHGAGIQASPGDDGLAVKSLLTAVLNHQTSCRWDLSRQTNTFVSVLPDGVVLPGALPVSLPAVAGMGRPAPHASTREPDVITAAGVLLHALRHLRHLYLYDATARRDMPPLLARHLEVLQPALAGLYEVEHRTAA